MAWGNRLLDDSRLVDGVTDCWTVWASVWLSGDAGQGEDVLFTTGRRAYLSHHPWPTWTQKWTRELRWNVNTSCPVLFPNFTQSFCFARRRLLGLLGSQWKGHLWTWEYREQWKYSIWKTKPGKTRTIIILATKGAITHLKCICCLHNDISA